MPNVLPLSDLRRAHAMLLEQAPRCEPLAAWLQFQQQLAELLTEQTVKDYITIVHHTLPRIYAESKEVQLLRQIELAIEQATGAKLDGVNDNGQFYPL